MASHGKYQSLSLEQTRKRTARDSDDIDHITMLPGSTPEKRTKLDGESHEMTMQRLSQKMEALSLADAHLEVLDTYELLEMILLQLPIKDLFVLQRTCKKWQKVIRESHALQKRMYLRQKAAVMRPFPLRTATFYDEPIKINPALQFTVDDGSDLWMLSQCTSFGEVNPHRFSEYSYAEYSLLQHHDPNCGFTTSIGSYREEASWKQMLITNPPVPAISAEFWVRDFQYPNDAHHSVDVYNPAGVRSSDLVDFRRTIKQTLRVAGIDEGRLIMYFELRLRDTEIMDIDKECEIQKHGRGDGTCRCIQRLESP